MQGHMTLWRAEFERPAARREPRREAHPERPRRLGRMRQRMMKPAGLALALLAAAPLLRAFWTGGA